MKRQVFFGTDVERSENGEIMRGTWRIVSPDGSEEILPMREGDRVVREVLLEDGTLVDSYVASSPTAPILGA